MNESTALTTLHTFRHALYGCLERRGAALMDLIDAVLTAGPVLSPAPLSREAVHRRGWGSLYAALADGPVNVEALRALLSHHPLVDGQPIDAVDGSVWPRCAAATSPQRGDSHHSSRHSGGVPVVAGWSYQWISQLRFRRDSGTAPRAVQRVARTTDSNTAAATQIKALLPRLPATGAVPLFVCDAGYDPVQVTLDLEGAAWRRWCACARIAASRRTRTRRPWPAPGARRSTAIRLTVLIQAVGCLPQRSCTPRIRSMAPCGSGPGLACIPHSRTTRPEAPARPARWSAAR